MCNFCCTFAGVMDFGRYDREDLQEALRVLREGGIIVYPTDTVWGIGCDATNEAAVAKIYALKQREDSKSMLVLLDSAAKLDYYVDVPEAAEMLLGVQSTDRYTDRVQTELQDEDSKPLTLIYPNARHLAPNLIAEDGSIGIRITNEAFSKALCAQLKHPVVSTSANISGHPTAHFFHEIEEAILNGADYVCRFRREDQTPHEPSSIIKLNADSTFVIIRE
ncbi:MAG: threonylcarbamoyl-AMP synthase [Paludibacteraceae bacterium]|nr:threonylcarbamoyl-AMP synthase [Paludibacteraceae bacterium]MBQ8704980.1 threonylcarbamoyl-AMP synthase [Paludibacteraceae bacterium]